MTNCIYFRSLSGATGCLAASRTLRCWQGFAFALFSCMIFLIPQPALAAPSSGSDAATIAVEARNATAKDDTTTEAGRTQSGAEANAAQWQTRNWHVQNTITGQGYPSLSAKYSGVNSLPTAGQARETVSLDLFGGYRLWRGAEFHADLLTWQGFGLDGTLGIENFPDGEAYKLGVRYPHSAVARFFLRQTVGLGGKKEAVPSDQLTLAGEQPASRLTLTIGRYSAKDIFDLNSYANDPRTQFMSWALVANAIWDYPADALGYTTGIAAELEKPKWALRYGFFQLTKQRNGFTAEDKYLMWPGDSSAGDGRFFHNWGMVAEGERRYSIGGHPGVVRPLAYLNQGIERLTDGRAGVTSVCTAHPIAIEAALSLALRTGKRVLIEATCNQVNQEGGYTGTTPADFRKFVERIAARVGLDPSRVILGGDHLGPNPWKHLPADEAMQRAKALIEGCVRAGFAKLHLDTSMGCAGEPAALADQVTAERAAALAKVAEGVEGHGPPPVYIIGTEVPVPGGAQHALELLEVTRPEAALRTVEVHQKAFSEAGLEAAFERTIGVVVQPGVEFASTEVIPYKPEKARRLAGALADLPGFVFEAHSTDYQPAACLGALVTDGFAILEGWPLADLCDAGGAVRPRLHRPRSPSFANR